jgi:hypothetical protein
MGKENITSGFVIGVALGILAILVSIFSDLTDIRKEKLLKEKN